MMRRADTSHMWCRAGSRVVLWAMLWAAGGCASEQGKSDPPPRLIAHAGGIGNQRTDTNSLEALDASVSRGHTVIEVDFSWTTDGHLVLLHDWEKTLGELFDGATGAMTLAEFRSLESLYGLSHLSLDDLVGWLEKTPGVLIVTDIKARNIDGLRLISEKFPSWRSRFVPQIFVPESIVEVRRLGFDRVIFSLYRSDLPDSRIVEIALESRPWAVTMPVRRAVEGNLPEELSVRGVQVFAHTVNDHPTVDQLRRSGVYGVYTDWLSPADQDHSGPLPEWSETALGEIRIDRWIVPFLSWSMDGMEATMELRGSSQRAGDVHLSFRSPDGGVLASDTILVSGGKTTRVDLGKAASGTRGHGWAEVEASTQPYAQVRWSFGDRSGGTWKVSGVAVERFETRGPGLGVGGILVAIVNPTDTAQSYRMIRSISSRVIDDEAIEVRPGTQLLRVYRSWTKDEISVSVSGGPMVVQTLRWDPLGRFMG